LAAGIPQVAVPRFLDQFDNCRKLERLGTSVTISSARFRADVVAGKLAALLESAAVRDRCRHCAELTRRDDCFATASAALEDRQQLQPCPAS
jgi:UDP:flavonoid glycosyltransferase YjiC (YdhE family)